MRTCTHLNSNTSGPQISLDVCSALMGMRTLLPFAIRISVCTSPFRSTYGALTGSTSSAIATRFESVRGAYRRSVSRTTLSRYSSAFSSSVVGVSVGRENSSSRSLRWMEVSRVMAYRSQVVDVLVVS